MSLARHGFRVGSPMTSRSTSSYQSLVIQAQRSISSSAYRNSYVGSTPITIPRDITIERVVRSKQTDQSNNSTNSASSSNSSNLLGAQESLNSGALEDQLIIRGKHGETSIRLYDYMRFVLPAGATNKTSSTLSTTSNSSEKEMSVRRRNPPCPETATSDPFVFTPQATSTSDSKPPEPSENSDITLFVETPADKAQRQLWGTTRTLIANAIKGQSDGYHIPIYLIGVGYRAALEVDQGALAGAKSVTITNFQGEAANGKLPTRRLTLRLGYSHPISVPIPDDITVTVPSPTIIRLWSRDKQKVGQFAADIRALRKPEVYKGKGVFVADEKIKMKAGKKK